MNDSPFDICAALVPFLKVRGEAVAVGVSGGPDSMALCHALAQAASGPVHAITVDHGLRPEAAEEAQQVASWLSGWSNVIHVILTRKAPPAAGRVQETARHDRYELMAAYCKEHDTPALFTAHHQDDQAETFLFRLAKGSGLDGLGAIRPLHDYNEALTLVRPFLNVPKSALIEYCGRHQIPYIADPSNSNELFARARLRGSAEILAAEGLTPKRLAVTAARLARASEALDITAAALLEKALISGNSGRIELNVSAIKDQPEELQLRVLSMAITQVAPPRDYPPRLEKLEELALRVFGDPDFRRASLAGCLTGIDREKGLIIIERETKSPN